MTHFRSFRTAALAAAAAALLSSPVSAADVTIRIGHLNPDDPFLPFYLAELERAASPSEMHNDAQ